MHPGERGLAARKVLGWPKRCKLAMHSCGSTAIKGCSWPNFWANSASFSLARARRARSGRGPGWSAPRPPARRRRAPRPAPRSRRPRSRSAAGPERARRHHNPHRATTRAALRAVRVMVSTGKLTSAVSAGSAASPGASAASPASRSSFCARARPRQESTLLYSLPYTIFRTARRKIRE